jgi:methylmalonyl-CoA mutase cobalamin-binding subunit
MRRGYLSDNAREAGVWRIYSIGTGVVHRGPANRANTVYPPNTGFEDIITFIQRVANIFK